MLFGWYKTEIWLVLVFWSNISCLGVGFFEIWFADLGFLFLFCACLGWFACFECFDLSFECFTLSFSPLQFGWGVWVCIRRQYGCIWVSGLICLVDEFFGFC